MRRSLHRSLRAAGVLAVLIIGLAAPTQAAPTLRETPNPPVGPAPAGRTLLTASPEEAYAQGLAALRARNLITARQWVDALLLRNPDSLLGLLLATEVERARGNLELAADSALRAARSHPSSSLAWRMRSLVLIESRQATAAEEAARRAITLDPAQAEGYALLGLALEQRTLSALLAEAPNQGDPFEPTRSLDEARRSLETSVAIAPSKVESWLALARVQARQQRLAEARASLLRASTLAPQSAAVLAAAASFSLQAGDLAAAGVAVDRALALEPELPEALANLALIAYLQQRGDEAYQRASALLARHPGCTLALVIRGSIFRDQGRFDDARADLENAARLEPLMSSAHAALGTLYLVEDAADAARRELELAVRLGAGDAATANNLGLAYKAQTRYKEAIQQFEKCLRLEPANSEVELNLAVTYDLSGGSAEAAASHYRAYLRLAPAAPERDEINERLRELEAR